jgi:hypothetical protein
MGWTKRLSDERFLRMIYFIKFHKPLNLKNPQTFNEKLQWLKLNDRKPEYTMMVDKYAVKDYVAGIIGEKYIIPTLDVWDRPEDIDWNKLPNQFVLKTNHDGGNFGVVVCKDKTTFNKEKAIKRLRASLKRNVYMFGREWPYKNVNRKIFAEQYIEDNASNDLPDYKFFCFDGEVKALFIGTERESKDVKFDFFDADFNHLDIVQTHPMSGKTIPKPENFEEMKEIATKLSKGIPHVRVDLYNVNGRIYFGEMTFYHHGGMQPFHPEHWDKDFGDWIKLPIK